MKELQTIPDKGARQWVQTTRPPIKREGEVLPGTFRLCKSDLCDCTEDNGCGSNVVVPSKNPGKLKIFCCIPCGRKYHARAYNKRHRKGKKWAIEQDNKGEQYRLLRVRPRNVDAGNANYKAHLERNMCPNATEATLYRCPSHMLKDYYSERKLCIVYAVLVDDMKEQWARTRDERYIRQYTTGDGRWLEDDEVLGIHGEVIQEGQ